MLAIEWQSTGTRRLLRQDTLLLFFDDIGSGCGDNDEGGDSDNGGGNGNDTNGGGNDESGIGGGGNDNGGNGSSGGDNKKCHCQM